MLETKRINEVCPCCGLKIANILVRFEKGTPIHITGDCVCGYRTSIDSRREEMEFSSLDGFKYSVKTDYEDEDAIDKWNRVHAE